MSIIDDRFRDVERTSPFNLSPFEEGKHAHSAAYDFQQWYQAMEPVTFKTVQIPLSPDQGRAIIHAYKKLLNHEAIEIAHEEKINELKNNLAEVFKQFTAQGISKFFLRFSSRSPKDAGFSEYYRARMVEILQRLVYKYPQKDYYSNLEGTLNSLFVDLWEPQTNEGEKKERSTKAPGEYVYVPDAIHDDALIANYQIHLFYEGLGDLLSVSNEHEAMDLFLNSERAFCDLQHDLRHIKNDNWGMNVVIREWDDHTNIQFEFRVFVCLGKVNAIAQYNPYCFYPGLFGREEEIKNRIVEHHQGIKDQIPYATYVIDYLVVGEYVKVVELNPFVSKIYYYPFALIY